MPGGDCCTTATSDLPDRYFYWLPIRFLGAVPSFGEELLLRAFNSSLFVRLYAEPLIFRGSLAS